MDKTKSMTRNQNHDYDDDDDASSMERIKTCNKDVVVPWSDLDHDVLYLVMMCLGVVDFVAFKGACKSWRTFALSNRKKFMASRPPMSISISTTYANEKMWYLKDFDGRMFKTIIPQSVGRKCVGLTCGYLVLFGEETRDLWLVNPITRHQLHFPDVPLYVDVFVVKIRTILVFSPSISGWVFVVFSSIISFYIVGKQGWNRVSSKVPIIDLHVFKGTIYTLQKDCSLGELKLHLKQKPKHTLLEIKKFPNPDLLKPELVSSDENLYLIDRTSLPEKVMELDFGEMKWMSPKKTVRKYAFFISTFNPSAAIKPDTIQELWLLP